MSTDYAELLSDISDEMDLCRNEGAWDIAALLDRAATAIRELLAERDAETDEKWRWRHLGEEYEARAEAAERRVRELEAALRAVDRHNDNPARYNAALNAIVAPYVGATHD